MVDLSELNDRQREAVEALEGPVLILAGAGSGKTRVLITRIAVLIERKLAVPEQIMALTFTNKAAKELRERLQAMIGAIGERVRAGTFHSTFARLLRRDISVLGYRSNFAIYDVDDSLKVTKGVLDDIKESREQYPPGKIQGLISRAKNSAEPPRDYLESIGSPNAKMAVGVYPEYQKRLKANNALDFDDLLLVPMQLFCQFPKLLESYRDQFKYILVDEYQDTNRAQYELVKALASRDHNICVVGDDDQSIYGWRGADLRNILEFEQDFPEAKVVRLEQNYRSTPQILDLAWNVIRLNLGRKEKKLWTQKEAGEKARLIRARDEIDEASQIIEEIDRLAIHERRSYGQFAVLYRMNAQSRVLEDDLRRRGIPYDLVGGVRFYERKEIKDVLAYLRMLDNPDDAVSILRIINVPRRGIGEETVRKLVAFAKQWDISVREALRRVEEIGALNKGAISKLKGFNTLISELENDAKSLTPSVLTKQVIEKTGLKKALEQEGTEEAHERIDNILEFRFALEEMEEQRPEVTLRDFLQEVTLMTEVDEWKEDKGHVTLMTLHSAKGLEFPVVFVAGVEDGVLPMAGREDRGTDVEEERRLFYVGMTRAMERLYLSYANHRRLFGNGTFQAPSPFLRDIPEELLEGEYQESRKVTKLQSYKVDPPSFPPYYRRGEGKRLQGHIPTSRDKTLQNIGKSRQVRTPDGTVGESVRKSGDTQFKIGERIVHRDFGEGTVLSKSGSAGDMKIRVLFRDFGIKTLVVRLAPIKKLQS